MARFSVKKINYEDIFPRLYIKLQISNYSPDIKIDMELLKFW
jgi:hypothetical protein